MLAYAAHRRTRRQLSPPTLIAIVGVHAAALTMVALAKMNVVRVIDPPTTVYKVPPLPDPPPERPKPQSKPVTPPTTSVIDHFKPIVPPPPTGGVPSSNQPTTPDPGPIIGPSLDPLPLPHPQPIPQPLPLLRSDPVLTNDGDALRPPYPEAKRRLEEEANLRLRLAIDERGRVVAVDPVGSADPQFLASARSHLLRYWRYRPATEGGHAVATSIVVTLRFRLDDA